MINEKLDVELNERQEKLLSIARFIVILFVLGIFLRLSLTLSLDTTRIQEYYAQFLAIILIGLGTSLEIQGIDIIIGNSIYRIVQDCMGWKSMYLLFSLYLATPNNYLQNLKYLGIGLVLLQVTNVVRVISTIYLAEAGLISFEIIHSLLWQWGLSIVVFGLWYYWYSKILNG